MRKDHDRAAYHETPESEVPKRALFGDGGCSNQTVAGSNQQLACLAEEELRRRNLRYGHLPKVLVGDVSWAMLLHLLVQQHRCCATSTMEVCRALEVSQATGLRWLEILEMEGLVQRYGTAIDKRGDLVALTQKGADTMRKILISYTN